MILWRRGLGYDYYDVLRATGIEDCDPRDFACVSRNQERDNAAVDYWQTVMKDPNTANLPTPNISVTLDTSQAAQQAFLNNQPLTSELISAGGGAPVSVATLEGQQVKPVVPKPPIASPGAGSGSPAGGGAAASGTPLAPGAPQLTPTLQLPTAGGFSFDSVPWWGWLAGAGVAVLAMRGK